MRRLSPGILLAALLLAGACGPALPEYSTVVTPSGAELKIESVVDIELENGERALQVSYRTDVDLNDLGALQSEIEDGWQIFQPEVERRGLRVAVIRAARWEKPSWERRGRAVRFVLARGADGRWAAQPSVGSALPGAAR